MSGTAGGNIWQPKALIPARSQDYLGHTDITYSAIYAVSTRTLSCGYGPNIFGLLLCSRKRLLVPLAPFDGVLTTQFLAIATAALKLLRVHL